MHDFRFIPLLLLYESLWWVTGCNPMDVSPCQIGLHLAGTRLFGWAFILLMRPWLIELNIDLCLWSRSEQQYYEGFNHYVVVAFSIFIPATSAKTLCVMYWECLNGTGCILRTHARFRLRPPFKKTNKKTHLFECEDFFFPNPESLLPWQQQKIHSKGSWAELAAAWLSRTNKRCCLLCHEYGCLLIAALLLLLLPWLICLHLISGFYSAGLLFSWYQPIPAVWQTHLFYLCYLE